MELLILGPVLAFVVGFVVGQKRAQLSERRICELLHSTRSQVAAEIPGASEVA